MKKDITLVLSGGGARGLAHIGVIEELENRGYSINSIAGTSMGALIGGIYAVGKMQEFKEWALNLHRPDILRLIDFTFKGNGLVKGDKVLKAMNEFIPLDTNIEDLSIKYTATAFDLAQHKEVVFRRGSLYDAIRASISIPTVFTPVVSGNSIMVDGGVSNNIPVNNAIRTRRDTLIAVNVNANIPLERPFLSKPEQEQNRAIYLQKIEAFKKHIFKTDKQNKSKRFNYFDLINNTISAMINNHTTIILENNPPDILIEISRKSAGTFDFYKTEELIEIGRYAAQKKLGTR